MNKFSRSYGILKQSLGTDVDIDAESDSNRDLPPFLDSEYYPGKS